MKKVICFVFLGIVSLMGCRSVLRNAKNEGAKLHLYVELINPRYDLSVKTTKFGFVIKNSGTTPVKFNTLTLRNFVVVGSDGDFEDINQGFWLSIKDSLAQFNGGCGREVSYFLSDLNLTTNDTISHIVTLHPGQMHKQNLKMYGCMYPHTEETELYHSSNHPDQKIKVQLFYENFRDTINAYAKKNEIWVGELISNVIEF